MSEQDRGALWHAVMEYVHAYHECRTPGNPTEERRLGKIGDHDATIIVPRSDEAYLKSCRAYNRVYGLIWDRKSCWWKPWTWKFTARAGPARLSGPDPATPESC